MVQVWNQNGRTPYITYEYTVLRDSLPPVPPPPVYTGADSSAGEVSVEVGVGGLLPPNGSIYDQGPPDTDPGQDGQKVQETNEVYEETAAIDCDQDGATGSKYTGMRTRTKYTGTTTTLYSYQNQQNPVIKVPEPTEPQYTCRLPEPYYTCTRTATDVDVLHLSSFNTCPGNSSHTGSTAHPPSAAAGPLEPGPDSPNLIWRVLMDGRISADELLINISTNHLLTEGGGLFSLEAGPGDTELSSAERVNDTLEFALGRKGNDSGDGLYQNKTVQSGGRTSSRSNRTR